MNQEDIVNLESNLCLLYAIFNALQTMALKQKFSCNNIRSQEFITFIQKLKSTEVTMPNCYSERDMLQNLKHLQTTGRIKTFAWKRIRTNGATRTTKLPQRKRKYSFSLNIVQQSKIGIS